nr:remorin-like [Ipomoea batatas]GMD97188.1 remorin-like [Ipomoea batatas]GMD98178.1 remorin-like [Ipomoea batatas]GMD99082.1 remorin-like [Ipomoea batatas]
MGEEENPPAHHSPEKKNERALSLVPLSPASQSETDGAGSAKDRDDALARVELEKRLALIKAWEENEKTVADNKRAYPLRAQKKLTAIGSWENINKATMDAQLRQIEENIEKRKAEHRAKMKNKVAEIHKVADEKRAVVEAQRKEEILKAEDMAAKFRSSGYTPKRFLGWFGC